MVRGHVSEEDHEETLEYFDDALCDEVIVKMLTYKAELFHEASQNIKDAQNRMKRDYDKKRTPLSVSLLTL